MNKNTPFKIISSKHNGKFHRSWEENRVLSYENDVLIGCNNKTNVKESNGEKWYTKDPALFYFHHHYWFNVIVVFEESDYFYYCNVSSPCKWKNENELHYIDYDVDIIVASNYTYEVVDQDEYAENKLKYHYPIHVQNEVQKAVKQIELLIEKRRPPFSVSFINKWAKLLIKDNENLD